MSVTIRDESLGKYYITISAGSAGKGLIYSVKETQQIKGDNNTFKEREVELSKFTDLPVALSYITELRTLEINGEISLTDYNDFRLNLIEGINRTMTGTKESVEVRSENTTEAVSDRVGSAPSHYVNNYNEELYYPTAVGETPTQEERLPY